jgi:serine/threonine protein kinase
MNNLIGQSLGRYQILEQLGEGGMAVVYKAFDTRLESDVAVKVIRKETFAPEALSRALKRFEREAKALAKLTHPNIVKVTDYGEFEGQPYLVMPFLPGQTLKHQLKGQPISISSTIRLLLPIAHALEYAHNQWIIHRDIKPSNILITESGEPMLSDFGVARIIEEGATVDLTGTTAVGTPEYMAPEQATSKSVDHRADIYSLGVVLYEMVTGRKPYTADTPLAVLIKHASQPLPRPTQFVPNLSVDVEHVILKALAKNPDDRYQTMSEFAAALEKLLVSTKENITDQNIVKASTHQKQLGIGSIPHFRMLWFIPIVISCLFVAILGIGAIAILLNQQKPSSPGLFIPNAPTPTILSLATPTANTTGMILTLPASSSATETSTPIDPIIFVQKYFKSINAREYQQTWAQLSTNYKNKFDCCNPDGSYKYQEYITWWNSIDKVEIIKIDNREQDANHALIYTLLKYYFKDKRIVDDQSFFHLILDGNGNWLIDDQGG